MRDRKLARTKKFHDLGTLRRIGSAGRVFVVRHEATVVVTNLMENVLNVVAGVGIQSPRGAGALAVPRAFMIQKTYCRSRIKGSVSQDLFEGTILEHEHDHMFDRANRGRHCEAFQKKCTAESIRCILSWIDASHQWRRVLAA